MKQFSKEPLWKSLQEPSLVKTRKILSSLPLMAVGTVFSYKLSQTYLVPPIKHMREKVAELKELLDETPFTKRKRVLLLTDEDVMSLSNLTYTNYFLALMPMMLPESHDAYKRVRRVLQQIIDANPEFHRLSGIEWEIIVLESPINNAITLPNGKLFIWKEMLNNCTNDDQLAIVIAHELAHVVLQHGSEAVSLLYMTERIPKYFFCALCVVYPFLLPLAFFHPFLESFLEKCVLLPNSRMRELEADYVALQLAAKACVDIREARKLWAKFVSGELMLGGANWGIDEKELILQKYEELVCVSVVDELQLPVKAEFLQTHPTDAQRLKLFDRFMDDALALRDKVNCPILSRSDEEINFCATQ